MSPRAFEPMQRARDFPRMPSPRRLLLSPERRLDGVEGLVAAAIDLAIQPAADTRIEHLSALPEPTVADIDRQVFVQLPGDTITSIYVGVLLPDGEIVWQLMAAGVAVGGETSPEFTFVGNVTGFGVAIDGVYEDSSFVWMARLAGDPHRYVKSTGSVTTPFAASGALAGQAITFDNAGNFYIAQPANTRIRKYNSAATLLDTTTTSKTYNSVFHRLGTTYILATSAVNNEWYKIATATMDTSNTVSASINAPQGICEDSAGNIYVANTGANTIRKYNSALVFQLAWGSAGSGNGQFSTIKKMWVDGADRIYVADSGNDRIQVFDAGGIFLGKFGSSGTGTGQLDNPSSVHGFGTSIVVADTANSRISRWLRN